MNKKSINDLNKLIEKQEREEYLSNLDDLMKAVSESSVFKIESKDEFVPFIEWTVGIKYTVRSDLREVRSIEANDEEVFQFRLTKTDYKKFATACNKRRAELLKQRQASKVR